MFDCVEQSLPDLAHMLLNSGKDMCFMLLDAKGYDGQGRKRQQYYKNETWKVENELFQGKRKHFKKKPWKVENVQFMQNLIEELELPQGIGNGKWVYMYLSFDLIYISQFSFIYFFVDYLYFDGLYIRKDSQLLSKSTAHEDRGSSALVV